VRSLTDQYQLRSADALDQSIIIRRCGDSARIFTDDCRIALNGSAHDQSPILDRTPQNVRMQRAAKLVSPATPAVRTPPLQSFDLGADT
jgi:hypothetical protein